MRKKKNLCHISNVIKMKKTPTLRTLQVLALEKEIRQSHIAKKINRDDRTVLRHLQELEKDGLARVKDRKRSEHGKPQNIWEITSLGLVKVLSEETIYEHIDEVVKAHSDFLPLVFGKWSFFEKSGLKKTIVERIKLASMTLNSHKAWTFRMRSFEEMRQYEANYKEKEKEMERLAKRLFGAQAHVRLTQARDGIKAIRTLARDVPDPTQDFINIVFALSMAIRYTSTHSIKYWGFDAKKLPDFLSKLYKDTEIRAYITEELPNLLKIHEEYVKNFKSRIDWWESLEEKPS